MVVPYRHRVNHAEPHVTLEGVKVLLGVAATKNSASERCRYLRWAARAFSFKLDAKAYFIDKTGITPNNLEVELEEEASYKKRRGIVD